MTTANAFGLQHLTPVLVVDEVEPCIRFWTDRFGFTAENLVPGDNGKLVFASVKVPSLSSASLPSTVIPANPATRGPPIP